MSKSAYTYRGPYTIINVMGVDVGINDVAELDDEFIESVNIRGYHKFEKTQRKPTNLESAEYEPVVEVYKGETIKEEE